MHHSDGHRRFLHVCKQHFHRGVGLEGQVGGEHLVHHNAERIKVSPAVKLVSTLPHGLFGRHVLRRANHHTGTCQRQAGALTHARLFHFGDPKVENLDHLALRSIHQRNIVGLDVTMNHSQLVRRFQCHGGLLDDQAHARHRQRTFLTNELLQAFPLNKLHDDEGTAVFGFVNVVHAHRIGMLEPAGNDRFMLEALHEELIRHEFRGNNLDRPHFIKRQMQRLVHRAHTALPHFGQETIFSANDASIRPGSDLLQRTTICRANLVVVWITSLACWAGLHVAPVDTNFARVYHELAKAISTRSLWLRVWWKNHFRPLAQGSIL